MSELVNNNLIEQIKSLLEASRQRIAVEVNTTLLHTDWQVGKTSLRMRRCISVMLNMKNNPCVSFRKR